MNSWLIKNARDLQGEKVELMISDGKVVAKNDLDQPYSEL
ncbi:MAG: hypothetical protein RL239_505, partial [Actinomycetota bacterium]